MVFSDEKVFEFDELADNNMQLNGIIIISIPFLLLYFSECGAIDVNEQISCQEVAIFTVLT